MSTTIRINFTSSNNVSIDPTFNNQFNDGSIGVKSTDLLDIAGSLTGVGLESLSEWATGGILGSVLVDVDVFYQDTMDYSWSAGTDERHIIKLTGLPPSTVIDVKGIGFDVNNVDRDVVWTVDGQQQTYDAGGGAGAPNDPVHFTTTTSTAGGELEIGIDPTLFFGKMAAMQLVYTALEVIPDTEGLFNSTLNYVATGLSAITSATLTDSLGNIMTLTSVTDTTAVIPDYGAGQRCLTGITTLEVSDGSLSATAPVTLLPKATYSSASLEAGFSKLAGDWTFGWDEIGGSPPVENTEGQWSHATIVYLGDGTVVGVTEATELTSYITDPADGVMAIQTLNFEVEGVVSGGMVSDMAQSMITSMIQ
jgi:hypothetical protein